MANCQPKSLLESELACLGSLWGSLAEIAGVRVVLAAAADVVELILGAGCVRNHERRNRCSGSPILRRRIDGKGATRIAAPFP